jgi:DNA-binding NtrC family response regulator
MIPVVQASPNLLIAETSPSLLEALPSLLRQQMPGLHLDVCTSHDQVMKNMSTSRYEIVIANVHLAGLDDRFLKQHQALQSFAPLLLTAAASERELACQLLKEGALDVITNPLEPVQAVSTIRLALWHSKLLRLLNSKEKAIEKYRQHMAAYPHDTKTTALFERSFTAMNTGLASVGKHLDLMMRVSLQDMTSETRANAFERLATLCGEAKAIPPISQPVTTILHIDDSSAELEAWSKVLRDSFAHYSILNALNIREGLDAYRNHKIDCLLLDLDLSDSSGF